MGKARQDIYLDYNASTPCDPRATEAMLPFLVDNIANPSSVHRKGGMAHRAVEEARCDIADAIGALDSEVIFTSGATESNNLALFGVARASGSGRKKIVTTPIEHKSVLAPAQVLEKDGHAVLIAPVNEDGLVDLGRLAELVDEETLLVSVQTANNEIGTIQPIYEIAQIAHHAGALLHTDAAQALSKIPIDVEEWGVDLVSLSSHKSYGPKGVGALYVRGGMQRGIIEPMIYGGGQENGVRAGTSNVPGVVGFGAAVRVCAERLEASMVQIGNLRDHFEELVLKEISNTRRNGSLTRRLPGSSSLLFDGVQSDALIANLPEISLSSSSACNSGAPEPSYVLSAIGLSQEEAYGTVRIGMGRFTTLDEIEYTARRISEVVARLRSI